MLANLIGLAAPVAGKVGTGANLLPPAVRAAQGFPGRQAHWVGAATLVALGLLAPLWQLRTGTVDARARAAELHAQLVPARAIAERNATNLSILASQQRRIAALQKARAIRSSWLEFLADLQGRLAAVEDVWLDQLTVLPAPPTSTAGREVMAVPPLQLRLSGRLLDTHNPVAKVSRDSYERVKQLLVGIAGSRFVASVGDERFDNSQAGLLRFDFVLAVDPRHPL